MQPRNPIQQRIHADAVKKVARQFLGMENFSVVALFMVAVFFLGAGWIPDALTNLFLKGGIPSNGIKQLTASIVIFLVFGLVIRSKLREVHQVKVVASVPASARVLILFLSPISPSQKTVLEEALAAGTIDGKALEKTSWEMPWLAVKHHAERLENLYVFTSSGASGTHLLFPEFQAVITSAFPGIGVEELHPNGVDFEDIAAVHKRLDELYDLLDRKNSYGPRDIIVDITGGQKTNSVAAAMATLSEGRCFQYVSTKNKEKVLSYDLVIGKNS